MCFTLSRLPYPFLHKMLMSNRATWKSELWGVHKFGLVSSRLKKDYKLGATVLLMYRTALMVLYVILIHCTSDSEPWHYIWLPSQIIKTYLTSTIQQNTKEQRQTFSYYARKCLYTSSTLCKWLIFFQSFKKEINTECIPSTPYKPNSTFTPCLLNRASETIVQEYFFMESLY